jgi:hypothetical protein
MSVGVRLAEGSAGATGGTDVGVRDGESRVCEGVTVARGGKNVPVGGASEGVCVRPEQLVTRKSPIRMARPYRFSVSFDIALIIAEISSRGNSEDWISFSIYIPKKLGYSQVADVKKYNPNGAFLSRTEKNIPSVYQVFYPSDEGFHNSGPSRLSVKSHNPYRKQAVSRRALVTRYNRATQ